MVLHLKIIAVVAVVACFSFTAEAVMQWAPAPAKHGHGGHDRHAAKKFELIDGEGASVQLINPQLKAIEIPVEQGVVKVKSTGMDNYHAIVATRERNGVNESAIRYIYQFGKPSGESPSVIMGLEKSKLEIEPSPYAREHWRYYGNTDAVFVLRFDGKPLANSTVFLKTENGTTEKFLTDMDGKITVPLPDDFSNVKPGRMGNRASEFVLSANYSDGEISHVTTFSSAYHANPEHWQSTGLGVAVMAGGMFLGGLVSWRTRRRKEK